MKRLGIAVVLIAGRVLAADLDLDAPVALPQERVEAAAKALQAPGGSAVEGGWLKAAGWALAGLAAGYGVAWADDKGYLEAVGGSKKGKKDEASHLTPPQQINVNVEGAEGDTSVVINIGRWICGR